MDALTVTQEENWYRPAPGEPYRPLIALPDKLKKIDPAWSGCTDAFFTGFDPPRTLAAADAMVPGTTVIHSIATPMTPTPGPSLTTGPMKTAIQQNPEPSVQQTFESHANQQTKPYSSTRTSNVLQAETSGQEVDLAITTGTHDQQVNDTEDSESASRPSDSRILDHESQVLPGIGGGSAKPARPLQTSPLLQSGPQNQIFTVTNLGNHDHWGDPISKSQQVSGGAEDFGDPEQQYTPSQPFQSLAVVSDAKGNLVTTSLGIIGQESSTKHGENSANIVGNDDVSHSIFPEYGIDFLHLSAAPSAQITTVAGHALKAVTNGVSVQGTIVSVGSPPITVSGTPIPVNSFSQVYFDGTPHQLPSLNPIPATTLANSALAVLGQDGHSIYGATLVPEDPGSTASGIAVSLDHSDRFLIASGVNSNPRMFASSFSDSDNGEMIITASSQILTALSTGSDGLETVFPVSPTVKVNDITTALDSAGETVVGSKTLAAHSPSGGFGSLIIGGLESGGPHNAVSTSGVEAKSPTTFGTILSIRPSSTNRAESNTGLSPWKMMAMLMAANLFCLHV